MANYGNQTDSLEVRAAEERQRLHRSLQELRGQIHDRSLELR